MTDPSMPQPEPDGKRQKPTALEWLDAVRDDLEQLRGTHIRFDYVTVYSTPPTPEVESSVRSFLKHTPDRLDRMEKALRDVLNLARFVRAGVVIPTGCTTLNAGYRVAMEDAVTTIEEALR